MGLMVPARGIGQEDHGQTTIKAPSEAAFLRFHTVRIPHVNPALSLDLIQAAQVLTTLVFAPFLTGFIAHVEARMQGRRGPRVLQTYYDVAKFFRKESLAPRDASWFFLAAPFIAFVCYLTVPMLIPVLTTYGLPLGTMGDILGGGFVLALASFSIAVASAETGSPYAQLSSSRAKTFSAITEPVILFVVFGVALITATDLPYALAETVRSSASQIVRPAHLLATGALFMVILYETGRIPVESHGGTNEFGMVESGRSFEHSGPYNAMLVWGSSMKQFVLYTLLINVFIAPWGLAGDKRLWSVVLAIGALVAKALALGVVVAGIDNSFAKLRLFKITEFIAAAFLLAVVGVFTVYLGGG